MKAIQFILLLLFTSILFSINYEKDAVKWDYESTPEASILHFDLEDYKLKSEFINGQEFTKIDFKQQGQTVDEGLPLLPTYSQTIAIPETGSVTCRILSAEQEIISNVTIYPYQKEEHRELVIDEDFYNSENIYPGEIINVAKPAIMRNLRLVTITVHPFQFQPDKNQLIVHKNMKIEVLHKDEKGRNEITKILPQSRHFNQFFEATVINYKDVQKNRTFQQPSYLFIYPNLTDVENTLQTLLEWKRRIGYEVHAYNTSQTGSTLSSIKNFIQNAYDTWENPPEFVTLVGDAGGTINIPTGNYGGGEGDQYYALLEGNDILADVFIGRLSANSNFELQTVVSKILNYEKQPFMGYNEWFNKALLVGDPSTSGQSCITTNQSIRDMIAYGAPNMESIEVYSGSFSSQMSNNINNGVSFFNYRGYLGMSGFNNSSVDNLNNGFMLPVVVTITCATGGFSGTSDSMTERLLKAGTPSNPKGAIASIGTATISTHTTFNNSVDAGIFYGLFMDGIPHMGGALNRGKFNLYHNFPNNPNNAVEKFSYWNNLMGDPGMKVWTKTPESFSVTYDETIDEGNGYYEVFVYDSTGLPVEDAWVTILQEENDIFATDYTNTSGQVLLPLPSDAAGTVDITITKQNFHPFLETFTIQENEMAAYLIDYTIFDGNSSNSIGNSDGLINPGETIELSAHIKNFGSLSIWNLLATLSCNNEHINLINDNGEIGVIPGNGTSEINFTFSVNENLWSVEEIYFNLYLEDGNDQNWTSHLLLPVFAAEVYPEEHTIYDSNNQIWDPGETVDFSIALENVSAISLANVSAEIICNHSGITLIDSLAYFGEIPANSTVSNTVDRFTAISDWQVLPGTQLPLHIVLTNPDGFEQTVSYTIPIGTVSETDPLGPDIYGYYSYDSWDTEYELAPTYDWLEIDPNYGGSGTTLSLNDNGDNGALQVLNLPFAFQFYGVTYEQITVCSNGFISPGITDQYSYMNWHIPGPLGPSPMIAPFWDDLKMASGDVCYYYNETDHTFIVQWSRLENDFSDDEETFQVVLYDAVHHPTITGDGDILFQYKVINNTNPGSYSYSLQHGQYATVGLEDHTSTIGLEYTYNNTYPTAARPLQNNMAILFTTNGGQVLDPPVASLAPSSFQVALLQNDSENYSMELTNTGEANLSYSISKNYIENEEFTKDSGGPDNYGYQWFDNNEPNGPTYAWREISSIGTQVSFSHNDQAVQGIPLEFDFPFYGDDYNEFLINPNGWIGFGEDNTQWLNTSIPNEEAPLLAIMPFWDDLDPGAGGEIYYYSTPDSLIVQFEEVWHYVGSHEGIYTFEVIIYPSGNMLLQYKSVTGDTDSATIGIQNEDASDALQIVYNAPFVYDGLAIEIKRVIEWINISNSSGIVASGDTANIGLLIESLDLDIGNYACDLFITTNDPDASLITVPVHLQVVESLSHIEVDETEINWGEIILDDTITDTLVVTNTGQDPLIVNDIVTDLENCSISIDNFTLVQNEMKEVVLSYTAEESGEFSSELTIFSNDPIQSEFIIPITVSVTETSNDVSEIVYSTKLLGNYPNPFNPVTQIRFTLENENAIQLDIYNIKGEKVTTLAKGMYSAGEHQIRWDGTDSRNRKTGSGIYFYRLQTKDYESIKKMILLK